MGEVTDEPERSEPRLSAPVSLTAEHDLSAFDCGEPALNDWLRHRALKNESRFSRTYVVCEGKCVIAYFCIAAGAVERSAAPGKIRRNAPDTIPVSVIGRLAVSRDHAGKGLDHDDFGPNRSKVMNVIDSKCLERDAGGKPVATFPHPALGADILSDALHRIAIASRSIGIGAVLVHAKDDAAKGFYMKCAEFIEYPADSRTLFLPIETVVAAFS